MELPIDTSATEQLIEAVELSPVEKKWKRTTKEEKYLQKYIGRVAKKFRGRKVKTTVADNKAVRRAKIRLAKKANGRRLSAEQITGLF